MRTNTRFADRIDAGRRLAEALEDYRGRGDVVVYGLPRGGVPVAAEVAGALDAPLDVLIVRKLGVPGQPELAMGAVASGGVRVLNEEVLRQLRIGEDQIDRITEEQRREIQEREERFRGNAEMPDVRGKTALVIDDGIATGSTMRASVEALRELGPERIVVAVPVASYSACDDMNAVADEVICLETPSPFHAVGAWYDRFDQTTDTEVKQLLESARVFT